MNSEGEDDEDGEEGSICPSGGAYVAGDHCLWFASHASLEGSDGGPGELVHVAGVPGEPGYLDGPGAAALFDFEEWGRCSLAVMKNGAVLVVDRGNNAVRLVDPGPGRTVTTFKGGELLGPFVSPSGVALCSVRIHVAPLTPLPPLSLSDQHAPPSRMALW